MPENRQPQPKKIWCRLHVAFFCFCTVIATSVMSGGVSTPLDHEAIQKMTEAHLGDAMIELEKRNASLPPEANYTDRREIWFYLIPIYFKKGKDDEANALISKLEQMGKDNDDKLATAMALTFRAKQLENQEKLVECARVIERASELVNKTDNARYIAEVEIYAVEFYAVLGGAQEAIRHQRRLFEVVDSIQATDWRTQFLKARVFTSEAIIFLSRDDYKAAINDLQKAKELAEKLVLPSLGAHVINNLGYAFTRLHQWKLASNEFEHSLNMARATDHPAAVAISLINLADVAQQEGNIPECIKDAQEALTVSQSIKRDALEGNSLANLGVCLIYAGKVDEGTNDVKRGIELIRADNNLPLMDATLEELATAYAKGGRYREAWEASQQKALVDETLQKQKQVTFDIEMDVMKNSIWDQVKADSQEKNRLLAEQATVNKYLIVGLTTVGVLALVLMLVLFSMRLKRTRQATEEIKYKETLNHELDPQTGLLKRSAFQIVVNRIEKSAKKKHDFSIQEWLADALVHIDMDHFNSISEQCSPEIGLGVLTEVGKRLQQHLRGMDMLMRWGGGEMLLYLHDVPWSQLQDIVGRLLQHVKLAPIQVAEQLFDVTISAGYIVLPLQGIGYVGWEESMDLIDAALKMAKSKGGNSATGIVGVEGTAEQLAHFNNIEFEVGVKTGLIRIVELSG